MPNTTNRLPPLAAKPRPVPTQAVRSASGHAVAVTLIKQAGPKPRFSPSAMIDPDAA